MNHKIHLKMKRNAHSLLSGAQRLPLTLGSRRSTLDAFKKEVNHV